MHEGRSKEEEPRYGEFDAQSCFLISKVSTFRYIKCMRAWHLTYDLSGISYLNTVSYLIPNTSTALKQLEWNTLWEYSNDQTNFFLWNVRYVEKLDIILTGRAFKFFFVRGSWNWNLFKLLYIFIYHFLFLVYNSRHVLHPLRWFREGTLSTIRIENYLFLGFEVLARFNLAMT